MEKLSYISTPRSTPYVYTTISQELKKYAALFPETEAFVFYDNRGKRLSISFSCLWNKVCILAHTFIEFGINKGEHVVVILDNSIESAVCIFGVIAAGGVVGFISPEKSDGTDVKEIVERMSSRFLVFKNDNTTVHKAFPNKTIPSLDKQSLILISLHANGENKKDNYITLDDILFKYTPTISQICLPITFPEDHAVIFSSSGSTGYPKLVLHSHFSLMNFFSAVMSFVGTKPKDVFFCDRPFAWIAGFPALLSAMGVTRVFMDTRKCNSTEYGQFLCKILLTEKCNVALLSPYVLQDIIETQPFTLDPNWKPFQTLMCSGQRLTTNIITLIGKFCKRIVNVYGSTEIPSCCGLAVTDHVYENGDTGYPAHGHEIKITDPNGDIVPVNQSGEINVRGCTSFVKFVGNPDTANKFRDNNTHWHKMGDVGRITDYGRIVIEGRLHDTISRGTRKIIPAVIEDEVNKCPGVAVAIAVPVPDKRLREEVCLCVIRRPGSELTKEQLQSFCEKVFLKEETMDGFGLRPTYYLLLENFPLLSTGKYSRRLLAMRATELLGLA